MIHDDAECGNLGHWLGQLGGDLDRFLTFKHRDAMDEPERWRRRLDLPLPERGIGIAGVMDEFSRYVIPNGSQIPNPGLTAFINTGATTIGALATLAAAVASPQRLGLTAFSFLEELSLTWLANMFELPPTMKGVYSSGGSVANLVALGGARQAAFEQIGIDPARDGVSRPGRIYATAASHRTIRRAAAVLGMGREAVVMVPSDAQGRMIPAALTAALDTDARLGLLPVAVAANAGTTDAGAIDDLRALGTIAGARNIWFHVDGAYGLPGILDPGVRPLFDGLELADSVVVDPHKWLGAPVGIGATFVRDREILNRAFTQTAADYLEGTSSATTARHSLDSLGVPYADFGVELSAPSRGAVVWAILREIGRAGLADRVCRHNAMAQRVAERVRTHPELELLQDPVLSICCFRYIGGAGEDLNDLNQRLHRELVHGGRNMPSTTRINGTLAIRPCFIGARTEMPQADALVDEVIEIGRRLTRMSLASIGRGQPQTETSGGPHA